MYRRLKPIPGECDRCGQRYPLAELRVEIVLRRPTGLRVCPACFDPDHPQLRVGEIRIDDKQAVPNPRPRKNMDQAQAITSTPEYDLLMHGP